MKRNPTTLAILALALFTAELFAGPFSTGGGGSTGSASVDTSTNWSFGAAVEVNGIFDAKGNVSTNWGNMNFSGNPRLLTLNQANPFYIGASQLQLGAGGVNSDILIRPTLNNPDVVVRQQDTAAGSRGYAALVGFTGYGIFEGGEISLSKHTDIRLGTNWCEINNPSDATASAMGTIIYGTLTVSNGATTAVKPGGSMIQGTNNATIWVDNQDWKALFEQNPKIALSQTNRWEWFTIATNQTQITGFTNFLATNGNWYCFIGGTTGIFSNADCRKSNSSISGTSAYGVANQTTSTNFDVLFRGNAGWITVFIEDEGGWLTRACAPFLTDNNSAIQQRARVNLTGGKKVRNILTTFSDGMGFCGFQAEASDVFTKPSMEPLVDWIMVGDSFPRGFGATNEACGYAISTYRATKGRINPIIAVGNGYLTGPVVFYAAWTNAIKQAEAQNYHPVFTEWCGGGTDNSSNRTDIITVATNGWIQAKAYRPAYQHFCFKPLDSVISPTYQNIRTNLQDAAVLAGVPYYDVVFQTSNAELIYASGPKIGHPTDLGTELATRESLRHLFCDTNMFRAWRVVP